MKIRIFAHTLIYLGLFFVPVFSAFSQEGPDETAQAMEYRALGMDAQKIADFDRALMYYQKAVQLSPKLHVVYNDMGIIYEQKGDLDSAESAYKKALQIKPDYLNPYANLACLYEQKGDFKTAVKYWRMRLDMGNPDDPWTKRAADRLSDIGRADEEIGRDVLARNLERETSLLISDVRGLLVSESANPRIKAKTFLKSANDKYQKGDYLNALNDALAAQQYDNDNTRITDLIELIQKKILIR